MNNFCGMGRLTRDPETRTTQSNITVCNFTIAINRRFKNASGDYDADFLPCIAWRQSAEFVGKYFRKGNMIAVVGSVQTRKWDDQEGKTHYATEVIVEQAGFCGSKSDNGGSAQPAAAPVPAGDNGFFPGDDDTSLPFDI
jgi:single-strand DNA-binding protein